MASTLAILNRLLPFATPGTPLVQDLIHLTAICLILYYAPQLQDWSRRRDQSTPAVAAAVETTETIDNNIPDSTDNIHDLSNVAEGVAVPQAVDNVQEVNGDDTIHDDESDDEATGSANGTTDRSVGAKKARSLARKDQRRAYHEFMRSQGEAQRARDAEGAAEREAALEAERKRRALIEAELVAKKAREREQKREAEQAEREAEYRRRESAIAIVKADLLAHNMSDLHRVAIAVGGDVDEEWVEKVINASGIIGKKHDVLTMITTTGWAARITEADARAFYDQAAIADISDEHGYMNDGQVNQILVAQLRG